MKNLISYFLIGVLFSFGLGISGMTEPANVIGFLDIFGAWNPALIFVMIGAIAVHGVAYRLIRKRKSPLWDLKWHVPESKQVTKSLMVGSALFGAGWALAGFCPGPAITALASLRDEPVVFLTGLIAGFILYRAIQRRIA